MSQQEIIEVITHFLKEHLDFYHFKCWLEKQGYTLEQLGFKDED